MRCSVVPLWRLPARLLIIAMLWSPIVGANPEDTLAERLCAEWERVDSVACEIHKTTSRDGSSITMLSRVFYQRPNRIHVENITPIKRLVIADGKRLYYHEAHLRRGYSESVEKLDEEWALSLRSVPGTPMRHLLRLRNLPETDLPGTDECPVRKGYQADKVFTVLCLDTTQRLSRIDFFATPRMEKRTARYAYSAFKNLGEWWFPHRHEGTLTLPDGTEAREVSRVRQLEVNIEAPRKLFSPDAFFEGVDFVSDFDAMYDKEKE